MPWEGTVQVTVNGINGTVSSPISTDPAALANITMAICKGQGYSGVLRYCKRCNNYDYYSIVPSVQFC